MNAESKILLIRHCKPDIDYSACDYNEAVKRIYQYNTTQKIFTEEMLPFELCIQDFFSSKKPLIFTSSMPRAFITSQELFGTKYNITGDDRFVEFDLDFIYIPFVKLKFSTWALISRILWFTGILKTKSSVQLELRRAQNVASFLYEEATTNDVILVAHGMLNMFIEKHLKKLGYKRVSKVKNGFFSITTLEM